MNKTNQVTKADKLSKFYIKDINFDESINNETPTKKRSKSQEQKEKVLKKSKTIEIQSTPIKSTIKPPSSFKPILGSIIDFPINELNQFNDLFKNFEFNSKYNEISKLSSNDWILKGFKNSNNYYKLIKKIIIIRFELSLKFTKIFKIINNYGNYLEKNDDELHDKMKKLQKLGEEITKTKGRN